MDVDVPLFNPAKRRRFMRKRPGDDERNASEQQTATATSDETQSPSAHAEMEADDTGVADIIRQRRPHRVRKGGIEFSTARSAMKSASLVPAAEAAVDGRLSGISDRFVGHSGQKVDVDKHMYASPYSSSSSVVRFQLQCLARTAVINKIRMAFIEAEMAKRRHGAFPSGASSSSNPSSSRDSRRATDNNSTDLQSLQRQPATLGKLQEIDLGPDSKLQNIARTERATRNLAEGDSATPGDDDGEAYSKSGKPTRSGRRRRNSEDIMRDRLVEEVLRESKLDVYEEPQRLSLEDDQAADDRIADQFRRDFLDAIHSRRRGARTRGTKTSKTDAPRGPKLGGSRSARAAMREQQNKAQK